MRVVAFDLGDTLVEYEGMPLSWEAHYEAALRALAAELRCELTPEITAAACAVLRSYNTRLNPRTAEVQFGDILRALLAAFGVDRPAPSHDAAIAFFSVFRQRLRCFPDATAALRALKASGVRIGVVTDVAYGMPGALVREDMILAGVMGLVDELITSSDAGARKPDPAGLKLLSDRLQSPAAEMVFVGNERKDVEAALAFGCEAVLLDRADARPAWGQHRTIRSLAEL